MKFNVIILTFLVLSMSLALATSTDNTELKINIFNNSDGNNTIEIVSNEYTIIGENYIGEIYIGKNYTSIFNFTFDSSLGLIFAKNSTNVDYMERYFVMNSSYEKCEADKNTLQNGWNRDFQALEECEAETNSSVDCDDELSTCNLKIQQRDMDIAAKNNEITDLKEEQDGTKNIKWIYAVIALGLGYVGRMFQKGEIGTGAREKARDEYNPTQAG